MINPSLEIGKGNWAIKESSLLGYRMIGDEFAPIGVDVARETAGTRVNSSGLVETVELLGSEDVVNGDFASGTTGWSVSYSGTLNNTGNALNIVAVGVNDTRASTPITTVIGKIYKYVADITQVQSSRTSLAVSNNSNLDGAFVNGSDITTPENSVTVFFTATATTTYIGFKRGGSAATGITNIYDNVSVKESTQNNLARVNYTGSTSSLLAEPQRTNLIPWSEDFSNWSTLGTITVTPNDTTSPSGDLTAEKVLGLNGTAAINQIVNGTSGIVYTNSCYIKNVNATSSTLLIRNGITAVSSLLNWSGSVLSSITNNTGVTTFTDEGNGWYRLVSTYTSLESVQRPRVYPASGTANTSVYLWGGQLEEGSYTTSYIPNFGTALGVTRNQDTFTKTGISDKINSEEGVLFVEMARQEGDTSAGLITLNDGTNSQTVSLYYFSTGTIYFDILSGSPNVSQGVSGIDTYSFNKIAIKYKSGDIAFWINGVEVYTSASAISLTGLNTLSFSQGNDAYPFYGKVKQLQVFKTALTDSELVTLTTI